MKAAYLSRAAIRWIAYSFGILLLCLPTLALAKDARAVFKRASESVVKIEVFSGSPPKVVASGSGVAITRATIVTNCHVLAEGDSYSILTSKSRYAGKLSGGDDTVDLCFLDHDHIEELVPAKLVPSSHVSPGEEVYAVGSPLGLENTISEGIISGVRRLDELTVFQTTAAISPGSSGGGLFNGKGELIGITTFQFRGQNINFAIPLMYIGNALKRFPNLQHPASNQDQGPKWVFVYQYKEAQLTLYIDASSVVKEGNLRYFTTVWNANLINKKTGETSQNSIVYREVVDCVARTSAGISYRKVDGPMGLGREIISDARDRSEWRFKPIPPAGTPGSKVASLVCQ